MPKSSQEQMNRFLALMDGETLTKKDFEGSFQKVLDLVQTILQRHEKGIQDLTKQNFELVQAIRNETDLNLKGIKAQVNDVFVGDQLKRIDKELKTGVEGFKEKFSKILEERIDDADRFINSLSSEVRNETKKKKDEMDLHLKTMNFNGKLDAEKSISSFKEQYKNDIAELKDLLQKAVSARGRGMGPVKRYVQRWVNLSSFVDGSTTSFTLPQDTVRVEGLLSTQFPQIWISDDYTLSGNTLTTNFTMQAGASLIAVCEVLFYP